MDEIKGQAQTSMTPSERSQTRFAQFGPVEVRSLSRIQKLVASSMQTNWMKIPHVTHHDEADITALDEYRRVQGAAIGLKLTLLPFLMKAAASALKEFPEVNASLDDACSTLVLKRYYHIGFAVNTPGGLLVPVLRDVNTKSIVQIASEIADATEMARTKGLPMSRMSGGSFTISSLGALGGVGFTPIINAPEVAILGISRAGKRPAEIQGSIAWKMMLPLSLSYDHRAINGSTAGAFCVAFSKALSRPDLL